MNTNPLTFARACATVGASVNRRGDAPASEPSNLRRGKGFFSFKGLGPSVSAWRRAGAVPYGTADNTRAYFYARSLKTIGG